MGAGKTIKAGQAGDQNRRAPLRAREPLPLPSAARVQPRGCKGRSPLHKITLVSPFPPGRALASAGWGLSFPFGEGGRGDGGRKDNKGRTGRRPSWQAPLGHHIGGGNPATKTASPPRRRVSRHSSPVPPGFSPRGCKGRSPLHKKTLVSPFPPGRGSGGWGQKNG